MFLGTQLPSWKQILKKNKKRNKKSFYEHDFCFLISESCMSINLIANAYKNIYEKEKVVIYLPDYFCNQTIYSFQEHWIKIIYYPITVSLDPDWEEIRKEIKETDIDFFVCIHYFGKYHASISIAKELCKLNSIFLIEDCAHVLYPTGKIGQTGDFVIYSPHKQIPVRDGAVLACNVNDSNKDVVNEIGNIYHSVRIAESNINWYIKKCIQKVIPVHRKLTYYFGVHMGEKHIEFHVPKRISKESYNTLCDYTYEDLKKIAYVRRDNLQIMNYIIANRYPKIESLMDKEVNAPYLAVYTMEKLEESEKKEIVESLLKDKFTLLYWPDLPYELENKEGHERAFDLSKNIITFPIHQGIVPQLLIKKFAYQCCVTSNRRIELEWITTDFLYWDRIFSGATRSNIPQERIYGDLKAKTEGWKVKRAIIKINEENAGIIQLLEKKVANITVAIRVNRGPVFIERYDIPDNHFEVMKIIRKKYKFHIPILYAPNVTMEAKSLDLITQYGWKNRDCFGYPSAVVDLSLSEEELYKRLKAFWRKHLKQAKKQVTIRYNEYNVDEILKLYNDFLEMKNIPGIPEHILKHLFALQCPPLEVLTAHNNVGEMIAYKVLYKHGNTGTSFIAWNTDEGREKNARTLLIYSSMLRLKKLGFGYFDLGGVDDINTEAVARFKRGMGGAEYRLLGEFIKL